MIQYTSGTTGLPRGAYIRNVGLANNGVHTEMRMGVEEPGVFVIPMPRFRTGGSVCSTIGAVGTGSTIVLVEAFDPGFVLELFEEYGSTAMLAVPTMLIVMIEHPHFATRDLSKLQAICSVGSLVPAPLLKRLEDELGAPLTIVFGQTERSPVSSVTQTFDSIDDKAGTIGPPMPRVETIAAFIKPAPGHSVDKNILFEHLRANLAPHKTPKQWFAVEEFPMTGSGKIQKFKLREDWLRQHCVEL